MQLGNSEYHGSLCSESRTLHGSENIKFVWVISKFLDWFGITDLHAILGVGGISLVQVSFYTSVYMNFVQFHYYFNPLCAIRYNTIQNSIENTGLIQISSEWMLQFSLGNWMKFAHIFYDFPCLDKVGYSWCTQNAVQQMFYENLSVEVITYIMVWVYIHTSVCLICLKFGISYLHKALVGGV